MNVDENVILQDIKKLIGPSEIYDEFDKDLVIHINSVFSILQQLGVGPKGGFYITQGGAETWEDYFDGLDNTNLYQMVKSYIYLKVRMIFDPPTGSVLSSYKEQIDEYEWRLSVTPDTNWEKEE